MGNFEIDSEDFLAYWRVEMLIVRDDQFEFWPDSETEISKSDIEWV